MRVYQYSVENAVQSSGWRTLVVLVTTPIPPRCHKIPVLPLLTARSNNSYWLAKQSTTNTMRLNARYTIDERPLTTVQYFYPEDAITVLAETSSTHFSMWLNLKRWSSVLKASSEYVQTRSITFGLFIQAVTIPYYWMLNNITILNLITLTVQIMKLLTTQYFLNPSLNSSLSDINIMSTLSPDSSLTVTDS